MSKQLVIARAVTLKLHPPESPGRGEGYHSGMERYPDLETIWSRFLDGRAKTDLISVELRKNRERLQSAIRVARELREPPLFAAPFRESWIGARFQPSSIEKSRIV